MAKSKESAIFQDSTKSRIGYRLGLYDPVVEDEEVEYIGRLFTDSPEDRAIMENVVRRFNEQMSREYGRCSCLAIFPVEL